MIEFNCFSGDASYRRAAEWISRRAFDAWHWPYLPEGRGGVTGKESVHPLSALCGARVRRFGSVRDRRHPTAAR